MHSIDASRAFLLLLGLPYHMAGMALFEMQPSRPDFAQSPLIVIFASVSHLFRMYAFFLLAGYFSGLIVEKRGKRRWFFDRMERLGIPLVAGLATVGVAETWLNAHLLGKVPAALFGLPTTIGHLWFLFVLILYCLTYFAIPASLLNKAGEVMSAVRSKPGAVAVLFVLLALWGGADAIFRRVAIALPLSQAAYEVCLNYIVFLPAFVLGALAWHGGVRERHFQRAGAKLAIVTIFCVAFYVVLDTVVRPTIGLPADKTLLEKIFSNAVTQPAALLASIMVLSAISRLVTREIPTIKFLVDGSIAIYVLHYPFAQILTWAFTFTSMAPELAWLLGTIGVTLLTIPLYIAARSHPMTAIAFCGRPIHPRTPRPAVHPLKDRSMHVGGIVQVDIGRA